MSASTSLWQKSGNSSVDILDYPARERKILRNFDLLLPKFHFILPKFYFAPRWGIFVFYRGFCDFLGGGGRGHGRGIGAIGVIRRVARCRDARECLVGGRPLYQRLQHHGFNGDGRTDRASLL